MRQLIKFFDFSAPKFNLFINGRSSHRTVAGGVFHLIISLAICIVAGFSIAAYIKRENPRILINAGYFTLPQVITKYKPKAISQIIKIEIDKQILRFHSLIVSGKFYNSSKESIIMEKCDTEENKKDLQAFCLDISDMNLEELPFFFISFPRCNYLDTNIQSDCVIDKNEYEQFLANKDPNTFLFSMTIEKVTIDPYNYTNKIFISRQGDSIYLDRKRGTSYIINLSTIILEEHKGWLYDNAIDRLLAYSAPDIEQKTSEDFSWNDINYSMMFTVSDDFATIYQIYYDDIFKCFSFIGGLTNCLSFLFIIKRLLSSHGADIFLMNSNFCHERPRETMTVIKPSSVHRNTGSRKEDIRANLLPHDISTINLSQIISKDPSAKVLPYKKYLKFKIFRCCLRTKINAYENFKWILDIQYLIKIYIQFHFLKNFLLNRNQVKFIETLSMYSKINVQTEFNLKNMYYEKKHCEIRRMRMLNEAKRLFSNKEDPYSFEDDDYALGFEENLDKKMANCDKYLTFS